MKLPCIECHGLTREVCQRCQLPLHYRCSVFCLLCTACANAKDVEDRAALERARRLLEQWEGE
jgi:hypothetical protein